VFRGALDVIHRAGVMAGVMAGDGCLVLPAALRAGSGIRGTITSFGREEGKGQGSRVVIV
jgi:hypothetical protein